MKKSIIIIFLFILGTSNILIKSKNTKVTYNKNEIISASYVIPENLEELDENAPIILKGSFTGNRKIDEDTNIVGPSTISEFKVDKVDENGTKHIAVQVEKGSERIPVNITFYGMKDGKNVLLKEVNIYKDEFDLENNYIMQKSLTKYLPAGYTFAKDIWSNTSNQYATEQYYASKIYMSYMLDELSTVRQTGETKNTVALSDEKANMILASSVSNDMKKKYEEAIQAQKDVTFESKVTESNLDSTAVNKLNAFAKSSGSKAVSTFDITLSMLIDGKDEGSITETSAPLTFNIPIPQELKKAGRKFYVLRYHD